MPIRQYAFNFFLSFTEVWPLNNDNKDNNKLYTLDKPRLVLKLGSNIQPDRKEQTQPEVKIIVLIEKKLP
jgi:hypothetical protein